MRTLATKAVIAALALSPVAPASASCNGEFVTELGTFFEVTDTRVSTTKLTDIKGHPANAGQLRYMRVQLTRSGTNPVDWRVQLREPGTGRVLQRFGPKDLKPGEPVWSDRLLLSEVLLTFTPIGTTNMDTSDVVVAATSYFAMPTEGEFHFYSAADPKNPAWGDLRDSAPSDRWRYIGDSVGIMISRAAGKASTCTGAMVGDGLFLTNWHCGALTQGGSFLEGEFWDEAAVCDNILIDFSWDDDKISDDFRCESVLAKDKSLDYALLVVESVDSTATVQPLRVVPEPLARFDPIYLIHHPRAMAKKISRDCRMVTDESEPGWDGEHPDSEMLHRCDTDGGSSGAPLLDDDGNMRALHHLGYDLHRDDCKPVDGPRGKHNKAVWMHAIVEDLKQYGFSLSEAGHLTKHVTRSPER